MIKTPPSPLKVAALVAFVLSCVVVLAYLWINFGGTLPLAPAGYRIQVAFPQANELATGADVRIAGVDVGKVVGLRLDPADSRTLATLELSRQYAPVPRDTRATLRIKTLIGETYVELSTGSRGAGALPDDGRLPDGHVQGDVALDQILSTFDPHTRRAFQVWMQSQAAASLGRGQDINNSFGSLPEFVDSGQRLLAALDAQSAAVRGTIANTGTFFNAISQRRGELSGLIRAADSLFGTTAQRNQQLAGVFKALPQFELQSRLALPALTAFGRRADPVERALWPIASQLTHTFAASARLAPQFHALFNRLGPTVTASERGLPAFDRILGSIPPLLGAFEPFLRNANPMVRYIGYFKHEITGFFANVTAATQANDHASPYVRGFLHYLRAAQTLTPGDLAFYSRPLGINRDDAYRTPGGYNSLSRTLPVLNTSKCANGNPGPPSHANPSTLVPMIKSYVFRTGGRAIAAPPCRLRSALPGFSTAFPQLRAEPPPGLG